MKRNDLLPCPFCAAEAIEYSGCSQDVPRFIGVRCPDCDVYIETDTSGPHIEKWNTRAVCSSCGNTPLFDDIDLALYGKGEPKTIQELRDYHQTIMDQTNVSDREQHHPDCNWWKWDWRYSWDVTDCNCEVVGPAKKEDEVDFMQNKQPPI